jgi:hypothetical protein
VRAPPTEYIQLLYGTSRRANPNISVPWTDILAGARTRALPTQYIQLLFVYDTSTLAPPSRANRSHPFAILVSHGQISREGTGEAVHQLLLCQARTGLATVAAFCESIPCLPAENSQTLGPTTKILSPYQGSLKDGDRCRQVFETFKGWRFKALAIGVPAVTRENEETLRLPDFIKDFTSYCNFSLPNRLMEHITLACQGVGSVVPLKPLMA